jgi:glycosyltransferase involved in cell wall biosynthesis
MQTHVLHLIQSFAIGGLERMVETLAKSSHEAGYRVTVAGYLTDGPVLGALREAGIETVFWPQPEGFARGLPPTLAGYLRDEGVSILHTHHLGPFIYGTLALALPGVGGVAHIHTEHSHEFYDVLRRRMVGHVAHRRARVVAVSEEVAAYHHQQFGVYPAVVPNGVRLPEPGDRDFRRARARAQLGIARDEIVIGSIGRAAPEKRHQLWLQAVHGLERAGVLEGRKLVTLLIGDGAERPMLEALATDIHAQAPAVRPIFTGARSDVAALVPALDVFALSSEREGLPLAALEAMADAVPVVATPVGDLPVLLGHGGGLVTRDHSVAAFREALGHVALNPTIRRTLGLAARNTVRARYSMPNMVRGYHDIYRHALASVGANSNPGGLASRMGLLMGGLAGGF